MDDVTRALEDFRDGETARVFLASTGAGAGAQKTLWEVPGISSTLVGAAFPYAEEAVTRFLGFSPVQFCSEETAIDLASAAFLRAAVDDERPAIGLGLTASVASRAAHRGEHRVHVAYVSDRGAGLVSVLLAKGEGRDARVRDGETCDALLLAALFAAADRTPPASLASTRFVPADTLARTRLFERPYFRARGAREAEADLEDDAVLFAGAFNPPHVGHFGAKQSVQRQSGRPVVFTTAVDPPHKAALGTAETLRRAKLLEGHDVLFTEGDPLYLHKARRFPGRALVIGADAFVRMLDPKWGVDIETLVAELASLGTRFYVIPRLIDETLVTLDDIRAMPAFERSLARLDAHRVDGRWDVSSSEIRAARAR